MDPAIDAPTPPARARNPRGKGDRLHDQLLTATIDLLERSGDASKVSLRAITKAAGVSPTAFYLQFEHRDEAINAAIDRCFERFNAVIASAAAAESDPVDRLQAMGIAYLRFTEEQPTLYSVIFSTRRPIEEDCLTGDGPSTPLAEGQVDREQAFVALVGAVALAVPAADGDEPRMIATMLWSSLHGYATLRANMAWPSWPEPEPFVERLLRGLGL